MSVKKTIQKKKTSQKKSNINKELVRDFKKAYANSVVDVCRYLTHDDNGDERLRGNGYLSQYGLVKTVYQQGMPVEGEIEEAHIIFSIDKSVKCNSQTFEKMVEVVEEVEGLLVEDFMEMMEKTNGEWFRSVDWTKASSILDLNSRMCQKSSNCWKFSFEPIDDPQGTLRAGWVPTRVKALYGKVNEDDYQHNRDIWESYGYESNSESDEDEDEDEDEE